ncbi:MAG: hypothetical protein JWP04_916 [Belnapia sp.]|nr:hypothetical protein [Belnapia sp.]
MTATAMTATGMTPTGMTGTEILAMTLRAEAGDRPVRALEALAALVVNRARLAAEGAASRARFAPGFGPGFAPGFAPGVAPGGATGGRTPGGMGAAWAGLLPQVCRAPFLFGCWNPRHPHRAALLAVLRGPVVPSGGAQPAPRPDLLFEVCRRIACRAAGGGLPDPTAGATHWHDGCEMPGWAIGHIPSAEIGGLVFYRLVG